MKFIKILHNFYKKKYFITIDKKYFTHLRLDVIGNTKGICRLYINFIYRHENLHHNTARTGTKIVEAINPVYYAIQYYGVFIK